MGMIRNYIQIAFRNLWRNKAFSAINILGLSLGVGTCLIIWLYIQNELSYDRFNTRADQIVRVLFKGSIQGERMREANVMPPVARALLTEYPEVKEATRLYQGGLPRVSIGNRIFKEDAFAFVDSNFFQIFSIPLLRGNPQTALLKPNSVILTTSVAKKYFGDADPIGQLIQSKDFKGSFVVSGIAADVPVNSHFHFGLFASMATLDESRSPSFMTSGFFTYLVLPKGFDYKKLEQRLPKLVEKYMGPQFEQAMGMTYAQFRQKGNDVGLFLQPLTDIHLHSDSTNEMEASGDIKYIYIFSAIAGFMLLIACINFMNLSTAGASRRAREVGIRKVMGSRRTQLVSQFLLESTVLTLFAVLISLAFVQLALPSFNYLTGKQLTITFAEKPWLIPGLFVLTLLVGIIAGSYPAFYLTGFYPVSVLKGKFSTGRGTSGFRSGLVVFQFFISVTLIVCTVVVRQQLSYIQHIKLGYEKEQVLILPETYMLGKNEAAFKQQLLQDPRIVRVSASFFLPAGSSNGNNFTVSPENKGTDLIKALRYDVDEQYIPALGMQMLEGRNFSTAFGTDSSAAILNETAVQSFNWAKNPLGRRFTRRENDGSTYTYHVIGVVKDFHFRSLHEKIAPLVMIMTNPSGSLIVKTRTADEAGLMAAINKTWDSYATGSPLAYSYMTDRFRNSYETEAKTGEALGIFSGLTIFISCLGLFGLVTFTAEQRRKEIGIRKVLGASASGIVALLSKDFLKLVGLALLIASPVAWFITNKWLEDFAYRINIRWTVFVFAGIMAIGITLLTISFRAIRSAIENPINSLRAE